MIQGRVTEATAGSNQNIGRFVHSNAGQQSCRPKYRLAYLLPLPTIVITYQRDNTYKKKERNLD